MVIYMEKQMRIELANEYPGGDGYYYASLELPAEVEADMGFMIYPM